jgi:hypothetical protein
MDRLSALAGEMSLSAMRSEPFSKFRWSGGWKTRSETPCRPLASQPGHSTAAAGRGGMSKL